MSVHGTRNHLDNRQSLAKLDVSALLSQQSPGLFTCSTHAVARKLSPTITKKTHLAPLKAI